MEILFVEHKKTLILNSKSYEAKQRNDQFYTEIFMHEFVACINLNFSL